MLVSVAWMKAGPDISLKTGWEMESALLNIFIALRLLVDHSKITPSREPEAKKLAVWMEGQSYTYTHVH